MTLQKDILTLGQNAREAAHKLACVSSKKKNLALAAIADALQANRDEIKSENLLDLNDAHANNLSAALIDRLTLTDARIDSMIQGIRDIIKLPDPVGKKIWRRNRPNGLSILKTRVPLGVIGIIYEARPNVTADVSALCIKTSNAVILRGGKECFRSNRIIARIIAEACQQADLPKYTVQLIQTTDREAVQHLVQMDSYVDVVIPRGGESLIRAVTELSRVPVLKHYKGVCHIFVDQTADLNDAINIIINAKCQRPSACNALETLLLHCEIAEQFLPRLAKAFKKHHVHVHGDATTCRLIPEAQPVLNDDYYTEYLANEMNVRVVKTVAEAIRHINQYGSHHSDAILTRHTPSAKRFLKEVDSAAVYLNASTRFTDGAEFGMGAEMGISTDKMHARGPVGLEELTSYKYQITGYGHVRP